LKTALHFGQPEIWNSDQGAQFTVAEFLKPLKGRNILISVDGRSGPWTTFLSSACGAP
jgi:putative transposase